MVTPTPLQSDLFPPAAATTERQLEELDLVISYMTGHRWLLASELLTMMGLPNTEDRHRWLRQLASQSDYRIASGPGKAGYILTSEMKPEDIAKIGGLKTQAEKMLAKWTGIVTTWHRSAHTAH